MRSTTIFFVLGLLVLARASEEVNVFAQMDSHPFGKTLLDLVQINMQSNAQSEMKTEDSINQISDLIAEIQADMVNNKKVADNDHKEFQDKANYDIDQYNRTLIQQRARRVSTQQQLDSDRHLLANTQADLKSAQEHLASVNAQIEAADAANVKAIAQYEQKVKELNEAIQACKEAVAELAKLNVGSFIEGAQINMIQIKGGMQKVEQALSKHLASRLSIYKPIITALVDMGTNADPALVAKVTGLINELRSALEAELAQSQKNEAIRVRDYTKLRADLVTDQRDTNARIGRNLTLIASLEQNIKQNQAIVDELNKSIPNLEQLLANRINQKNAEQAQYNQDNASRVAELKIIGDLAQYFQEKFQASMSTYLRSRVASL